MVGAGGVKPPPSSVSGHARPFARSVATVHGTTSALLRRVTEPGTAERREAAYGIAADKLLTEGRELHSIWRTSVRAETDGRPLLLLRRHRRTLQQRGGSLHGADVRRLPGRTRLRQRPLSGDDPGGDARWPRSAPNLGAGAEGRRQPPAHRSHASAPGCRGA